MALVVKRKEACSDHTAIRRVVNRRFKRKAVKDRNTTTMRLWRNVQDTTLEQLPERYGELFKLLVAQLEATPPWKSPFEQM